MASGGGPGGSRRVPALASKLEDPRRTSDCDQNSARHCRDEQRHAQGQLAGGAKIMHGHAVLILQDEDDQ